MTLNEQSLQEILKNPLPSDLEQLKSARDHEDYLTQFYENKNPKLIYDFVKPLLTDEKYTKFETSWKNHAETLVNKVITHYGKVMHAHGKSISFNFGTKMEGENSLAAFDKTRKTMYSGISDDEFWKNQGIVIKLIKPSSFFVVSRNRPVMDKNVEALQVDHVELGQVYTANASIKGLEYLILTEKKEVDGKSRDYYFTYDDEFFWTHYREKGNYVLESQTPHGFSSCPAVQAETQPRKMGCYLDKKSRLSNSCSDFIEYSILKIFYKLYKYWGAFGKNVRAELLNNEDDEQSNVPIDPFWAEALKKMPKNPEAFGSDVVIPIQMQNEEFISNFTKINYRIDADTNILTFHSDDIKELKQEILRDCIGEGYGDSYRMQAVNKDQVASNFDDQESNLLEFKTSCESTMTYIYNLFATQSQHYVECNVNLGFKWFLKSNEQLYKELDLVLKSTSNDAAIFEKQEEILLAEHRNNDSLFEKYKLVRMLKPFSFSTPDYVNTNRASLELRQAESLKLYDNFGQALSIFEGVYGSIETFGIEKPVKQRLSEIKQELLSIINEIILDQLEEEAGEGLEDDEIGEAETDFEKEEKQNNIDRNNENITIV